MLEQQSILTAEQAKKHFAAVNAAVDKCQGVFLSVVGKVDPGAKQKVKASKKEFNEALDASVDAMLGEMKLGNLGMYKAIIVGLSLGENVDAKIVKSAKALEKAKNEFGEAKSNGFAMLKADIISRKIEITSSQHNKLIGGILLAVVGVAVACLGFSVTLNKLYSAAEFTDVARVVSWNHIYVRNLALAAADREVGRAFISAAVGTAGVVGGVIGYLMVNESESAGKLEKEAAARFAETCKTNSETLLAAVKEFMQALPREAGEKIAPEFVKALEAQKEQVQEVSQGL